MEGNTNAQPPAYNPGVIPNQTQITFKPVQPSAQVQVQNQPVPQQVVVSVVPPPRDFPLHPTQAICPHCQTRQRTAVEKRIGAANWIIAAGLCFFGCWCCVPCAFCVDDLKDSEHFCSKCNTFLGSKRVMS
eukprot:144839_1